MNTVLHNNEIALKKMIFDKNKKLNELKLIDSIFLFDSLGVLRELEWQFSELESSF